MSNHYQTRIHHNLRLPMRDGIELSANLWLPSALHPDEKFPAILEMIPYRKDDFRYNTDHRHGQYWAERGYAFCRLDVRGWECGHVGHFVGRVYVHSGCQTPAPTPQSHHPDVRYR